MYAYIQMYCFVFQSYISDSSRQFKATSVRFPPQSLLKTADQLKIKGLCEVPENRDGPPPVSLSSPPRESGTPRLNYTKLKKHHQHHQRYKRPRLERSTFEPRATDPRHYERYKEEEGNNDYSRDNKEVAGFAEQCLKEPSQASTVAMYHVSDH